MTADFMKTMAGDLNPAQYQAATFGKGPALVIAGAGSGKTKTLVYRVAWLVVNGIAPESILLLTFTRRSAQEMLRRATTLLDSRCQNVSGGTFHAFSHGILHRYATKLGYPDGFTIMDRSDSEELMGHIRVEMGYQKSDKRFPKKNTLLDIVGKSINTCKPVAKIVEAQYPQFMEFSDDIRKVAEAYYHNKRTIGVMDYDDLLINFSLLLGHHPDVTERMHRLYPYVMVDEYQDTNAIQSDIVQKLAGPSQNVLVVGDDAQSIYSFRGANFKNIMNFPTLFPNTTLITLEENYRSTQPILNMTNAVINRAREKYAKNLFTSKTGGDKPIYVEADDEHSQSRFVVQKILSLREEGIALSDIAVLFRSGWHSNDLEVELKSSGIPYVKYGGIKFMEASHIKDIICFLRVMANKLDRLSWQRVLLLINGLGPKAASDITQGIDGFIKSNIPFLDEYRSRAFFEPLSKLWDLIYKADLSLTPKALLESVVAIYTPLFKVKYDDYHKRTADIDSILGIAERFGVLGDFLTELSLEPP